MDSSTDMYKMDHSLQRLRNKSNATKIAFEMSAPSGTAFLWGCESRPRTGTLYNETDSFTLHFPHSL